MLTYPLAFVEISVKERVKNILSNQKTTRSITILGIVVCILLAVCFLTNPASGSLRVREACRCHYIDTWEPELPITGRGTVVTGFFL